METILVKNMVCDRCVLVVQNQLKELGISGANVTLGEVKIDEFLTKQQRAQWEQMLQNVGFELVKSPEEKLVEDCKKWIIELVYSRESFGYKINTSDYLVEKIGRDYKSISSLFKEKEGITLASYFIMQRIERVKMLLMEQEKTLAEIADDTGYSSVAHLSGQFKKSVGCSITEFRQQANQARQPIDKLVNKSISKSNK
ncbi:MAG: helix-turn-helix domain-containing protein [Spirosomataceae bacterium]